MLEEVLTPSQKVIISYLIFWVFSFLTFKFHFTLDPDPKSGTGVNYASEKKSCDSDFDYIINVTHLA